MHKKLAFTFISFALIPLLIVTQLLLAYTYKNQAHTQAEEAVHSIKTDLGYQLSERLRDVQLLSLSPVLVRDNNSEVETYCNRIVASHPFYKLIMRVNNEGIVEAVNTKDSTAHDLASASLIGKSFERSSWYQHAITSEGAVMEGAKELGFIKSLYPDQTLKVVPISAPIRDRSGTITGVWVAFLSLNFIDETLKEVAKNHTGQLHLEVTDPTGQVMGEYRSSESETLSAPETGTDILKIAEQDWHIKSELAQEDHFAYLKEYLWPLLVFMGMIIMYAFVAARRFVMPWQRLTQIAALMAQGQKKADIPYQNRKDEVGQLARILTCLKPAPYGQDLSLVKTENRVEATSKKVDETVKLVSGLSAQANILALNASIEAASAHHLDEVAETANELAQRTSYNSQELLHKLGEIKALCDEIQTTRASK